MPKKILLVDDSDVVAGMLGQVLEEDGFSVLRAVNGVEGVEKTYAQIPDLIIMDVEMPLLQGYQASRLLKSRRGVREIPIIMHTSLSEDKHKYWAVHSGADAFVTKDFDKLDVLLGIVRKLSSHPPLNETLIREDGISVTRERIFEMIGSLFDRQLFQSTILNLLGDVGRMIGSLTVATGNVLKLLSKVCDAHIAVLMIRSRKDTLAYILPGDQVCQGDLKDFLPICQNDFLAEFPGHAVEKMRTTVFGIEGRDDFAKMRLDARKISSYACFPLKGKGNSVVATLHIGNFTNNYFSDHISENIAVFAQGSGIIIENSILFTQVNEMQFRIRNLLSKFLPPEVIDDLLEKETQELLVGEKRKIVILFSDIRSFTTISENNPAEAVVRFLNSYLEAMGEIIVRNGGTIDKFIGDAILAVFGAPKSYEDNGARAIRAAVEMIEAVRRIETGGMKLPPEGFRIGIGVHEGEAIIGNIGSKNRYDYTAIGDPVNVASRLEGLTKYYRQTILVSDTVEPCIDCGFFGREVDTVKLKGKDKPTTVYSVEAEQTLTDDYLSDYAKALKMYRLGNWDIAIEYFRNLSLRQPDDALAAIFLERCQEFKEAPPADWDGAIALDYK